MAAKVGTEQQNNNLPRGSALDPDMKVVKNYVRKTAEDPANQDETQ